MKPLIKEAVDILNIVGLNPHKIHKVKSATLLLLTCILVTQLAIYIRYTFKEKLIIDAAADISGAWQIICKVSLVLLYNIKLSKLLKEIEEFWPAEKFGKRSQKRIAILFSLANKIRIGFNVAFYGGVVTYCCKPLISRSKTFPFPCYLFSIDIFASPLFEIIYAYQTVTLILAIVAVVAFDILFMSITFHVLSQFILIKEGWAHFSDVHTFENDNKFLEEVTILAKHQDKMLRFVKNMDSCYSMLMAVQFLTCTVLVCVALLTLGTDHSGGNVDFMISNVPSIMYLIAAVTQMFWYCMAGNMIVAESESVAFAVYDSKWWIKTQPKLRRSIALVILRSHKSVKLTAGIVFDLDLPTFTSMMTKSFSLFTLVRTVLLKSDNKM